MIPRQCGIIQERTGFCAIFSASASRLANIAERLGGGQINFRRIGIVGFQTLLNFRSVRTINTVITLVRARGTSEPESKSLDFLPHSLLLQLFIFILFSQVRQYFGNDTGTNGGAIMSKCEPLPFLDELRLTQSQLEPVSMCANDAHTTTYSDASPGMIMSLSIVLGQYGVFILRF